MDRRAEGPRDHRALLAAVRNERIADLPPLVAGDLVRLTSNEPRETLAATVARLQRDWPAITAAAVRPSTLNDVYHHLTGMADGGEKNQ